MNLKKFYNRFFPYIFIIIFLALSILLITHHEFWRDEVHAWDIAKDSQSLSQFVHYMRQSEGTPYLWNFILFLVSHFISSNIEVMKVIHLTFSTAAAFLFLKFAPFNKLVRVLFVFGYFSFFEYSIISRNYALGILLIFVFCILYKNKFKNILFLSIVLFFMGQCNIYSFFISVSFMFLLLIDFIKQRNNEFKKVNKISLSSSIVIALSEIVLVYWQIGGQFLGNFVQNSALKAIISGYLAKIKLMPTILLNSYIPIPVINLNFWNTNLLVNLLSKTNIIVTALIALIFVIISVLLLNGKLKAIFLVNLFVILNFMIIFYFGSIRHWGHIFILFFACLWLSKNDEEQPSFYTLKSRKLLLNIFIIMILACSLVGSVTAFYYDYRFPFSNGKNVSQYLKKNFNINNILIIGYKNYTTETIAGYLDKDFYYPEEQKFSKVFNMITKQQISADNFLSDTIKLKLQNLNKEILIINDKGSELPEDFLYDNNIKLNKDFSNAVVPDENYKLFFLDNNLNFEILKRIDVSNFKESWRNLKACEFQTTNDGKTLIKVLGNDPNFESNFPITAGFNLNELLIKIDMESSAIGELVIYYKRTNSQYNEKDKSSIELRIGLNTVIIIVKNINKLERIRIDPVNLKTDCIIDKIEIYCISQK